MTVWYNIGRQTFCRSAYWFSITCKVLSNKCFCSNINLIPNTVPRDTLVPFIRHLMNHANVKKSTLFLQTKCLHEGSGSESESDSELEVPEDIIDLYNEPEMLSLRSKWYSNSDDPLVISLNRCTSLKDVFDFIRRNKECMVEKHVCQAILILWDLQKYFYKASVSEYQNPIISSLANVSDALKSYVTEVCSHSDFELFLQLVDKWNGNMNADELTASCLYLSGMGIGLKHPVMQKILTNCENMLQNFTQNFPLTAVSRFIVGICGRNGLRPSLISKEILPLILSRIETCDNVEAFRLITVCFLNISELVSDSTLEIYKMKVEELIDKGIITSQDAATITKIVRFLNFENWSHKNSRVMRKLLLLLKGKLSKVTPRDLICLNKIFQSLLEPADMANEMNEAVTNFLSQAEDPRFLNSHIALNVTTSLLSCLVSLSSPTQKTNLEKLAQHYLENSSSNSLPVIFRILRHLKTSNTEMCDAFWSRTIENIEKISSQREDNNILRISHWYMHFNNNLGGTYRHYKFEKKIIDMLWNYVENGTLGVIPSKFARVVSFTVAYANIHQRKSAISENIKEQMINKVIEMAPQFSKIDCLYISKGLQIGTNFINKRKWMPIYNVEIFKSIDTVMNNCALQFLKEEDLKVDDINILIKAYICRKGFIHTDLFTRLIQRYENINHELSSRFVRDISSNLLISNYMVPNILHCLISYISKNEMHTLGETVAKLLYTCYTLGYIPDKTEHDKFFSIAGDILIRDKERLHGLVLLQSAIALCFYFKLPEELMNFIFTVTFLERLDEEVLNCYAKASYPSRIRHAMMQLNRAVCLDYPEKDVPWFHKNYCQQIAALELPRVTSFHEEVHNCLISILGKEDLVQQNEYSPYFYRIDFQILLNKSNKPITSRHLKDSNITRIAVLLWNKMDYTSGVSQLIGRKQLKQRHLEILGYKVVGISNTVWNSMYMSEPKAKEDYLRDKIWPNTKSDMKELYESV